MNLVIISGAQCYLLVTVMLINQPGGIWMNLVIISGAHCYLLGYCHANELTCWNPDESCHHQWSSLLAISYHHANELTCSNLDESCRHQAAYDTTACWHFRYQSSQKAEF